jgi:hypothetical protein
MNVGKIERLPALYSELLERIHKLEMSNAVLSNEIRKIKGLLNEKT